MIKAHTVVALLHSIEDGKFTLDGRDLDCNDRLSLSGRSLKSMVGLPAKVNSSLVIYENQLSSLEGIPEYIKYSFFCGENNLTSLEGIHKLVKFIGEGAYFRNNPIKSHVLGLLKIEGLSEITLDNQVVADILNKHLLHGKDLLDCQEELIEAGFPEFAQM